MMSLLQLLGVAEHANRVVVALQLQQLRLLL
jgi:hypothetical protein